MKDSKIPPKELLGYMIFKDGCIQPLPNMPDALRPKFEEFKKSFEEDKHPRLEK